MTTAARPARPSAFQLPIGGPARIVRPAQHESFGEPPVSLLFAASGNGRIVFEAPSYLDRGNRPMVSAARSVSQLFATHVCLCGSAATVLLDHPERPTISVPAGLSAIHT